MRFLDRLIIHVDQSLKVLLNHPMGTGRVNPAAHIKEGLLSESQRKHIAGLMRVNHSGEVAAQGLYQGQSLQASPTLHIKLQQAAQEENDHLLWCNQRLNELGARPSILTPVWYCGALSIGYFASLWGDQWSLGFLAETEKQVGAHLQTHLHQLSYDPKSYAIVYQMWEDECQHETMAINHGGVVLPTPITFFMRSSAKIMTRLAYYI